MQASDASLVMCDVSAAAADARTVDALARLRLAAKHNGCQMRLQSASPELRALIELMGLRDVLE
jgi:ABC-type transporter Mla MlaB component